MIRILIINSITGRCLKLKCWYFLF